jgi:hypothetical protein
MATDAESIDIKFELHYNKNIKLNDQSSILAQSYINTKYLSESNTPKNFILNLEANNNIIGKM